MTRQQALDDLFTLRRMGSTVTIPTELDCILFRAINAWSEHYGFTDKELKSGKIVAEYRLDQCRVRHITRCTYTDGHDGPHSFV